MNDQTGTKPPDYLIIGHITKDQIEAGYRLGGTVTYSGLLAQRMGLKVAIYTSGASGLNLDILGDIDIYDQPGGDNTTTFVNEYTPDGRVQRLLDRADELDLSQIPPRWKSAKIIHLAPVAQEIPLNGGSYFTKGFLGYSLQGWMRSWDKHGWISPAPLSSSSLIAGENTAGFVSIEDLGGDQSALEPFLQKFPTLLYTLGPGGVELHTGGRSQLIPAPPTEEVDATGAGDIFAAAFLILWKIKGLTAELAAALANELAALSIRQPGIKGIPSKSEITVTIKV